MLKWEKLASTRRKPPMPATFILSLDTEIAWGTYNRLQDRAEAFDRYPELLRRLVRQLDTFDISATWALVGHLLLEPGEQTTVPQPQYSFADHPDAARVAAHPPAWFHARYVLDAIRGMRAPQEISTHTFTHVLATDPGVSRELFDGQLAEVRRVYALHHIPAPRTLIYPQNRIAYTDVLAEHGIIAYRGPEQSRYARLPKPLRRPAHLLNRATAATPPTYPASACREAPNLVNLPASQFLMSYDGVRAYIPTDARVQQARKGLRQAIQRDEIYHLWFHPFNLGSGEAMFDALTQILAMVWEGRSRGDVRVLTMVEAASLLLNGDF